MLTLLAICTFFASVFPVLPALLQDPYALWSTFTDLQWFLSGSPPGVPPASQVFVVLPFLSAFLAWRFHRFYQQSLDLPAEDAGDSGDLGSEAPPTATPRDQPGDPDA